MNPAVQEMLDGLPLAPEFFVRDPDTGGFFQVVPHSRRRDGSLFVWRHEADTTNGPLGLPTTKGFWKLTVVADPANLLTEDEMKAAGNQDEPAAE